jgi:hypothetical protein
MAEYILGRAEAANRGLTPLFYNHVNPYGTFRLNMEQRIPIKLKLS